MSYPCECLLKSQVVLFRLIRQTQAQFEDNEILCIFQSRQPHEGRTNRATVEGLRTSRFQFFLLENRPLQALRVSSARPHSSPLLQRYQEACQLSSGSWSVLVYSRSRFSISLSWYSPHPWNCLKLYWELLALQVHITGCPCVLTWRSKRRSKTLDREFAHVLLWKFTDLLSAQCRLCDLVTGLALHCWRTFGNSEPLYRSSLAFHSLC